MKHDEWIYEMQDENKRLKADNLAIRKGAHDWKKRARTAEKRCVELLKERNVWQDEHAEDLKEMAHMLSESDMKLAKAQTDLQNAMDDKAEIEYELLLVKAHAYDLAFGNPMERSA